MQPAESECWHGEEIHRRNRFTMVAQERSPALGWLGIIGSLSHPSQNGSLGDIEPQHSEFAVNSGCALGAVLGYHPKDQFSHFTAGRLPPNDGVFARKPLPVQLKSGSMPTHHGLWLD
jgi:hypothetical protein